MIDQHIEKTVLSTIIYNRTALENCITMLDSECFGMQTHRAIFDTVKSLYDSNSEIDIILVAEKSKIPYEDLALIAEFTVSSVESHCKRLVELKNMRALYKMSTDIQAKINTGDDYTEITELIETTLNNSLSNNSEFNVQHIRDSVADTFDTIEGKNGIEPVHLGFPDLDRVIGGIFPGEFVVIGARPGMGKTAFLLNAMMNVSKTGGSCLMFSLEMKTTQLVTRYLASEAEVDSNRIRNRNLMKSDYNKLSNAASVIYDSNIYVNSSKKITVHDIKAIARRHVRNHPDTKIIAVDYLQLIKNSKEFRSDRLLAAEEKSQVLTELAAELNISVVALAQLSRQCEMRTNKRPILSDIKEAGQIEQDAHIIAFLYRGYKYGDKYKGRNGGDVEYRENDVDVIIAKNREGETGTVMLEFEGKYSKFYNIDVNHNEEEEQYEEPMEW